MGKTVGERVSEYRQRQKDAGMVHLSLLVPASEAAFFREMASLTRHSADASLEDVSGRSPRREAMSADELRLAERWATRSGLKLRLTRPGLRLSEVLARNIVHEIVVARWPEGANLGTEAQLIRRYEVSRRIMREAVRLLESQSIAAMRRGASGGLIVTEPTLDSAAYPAGVFLESRRFDREQMLKTFLALQGHVVERCLDRVDEQARDTLARCLMFDSTLDESASGAELQSFYLSLAKLTGDPSLQLFLDVLLRKARFESRYYRARKSERKAVVNAVRQSHAEIARALMTGDRDKALQAIGRRFEVAVEWQI